MQFNAEKRERPIGRTNVILGHEHGNMICRKTTCYPENKIGNHDKNKTNKLKIVRGRTTLNKIYLKTATTKKTTKTKTANYPNNF